MCGCQLKLWFVSFDSPSLLRSEFSRPGSDLAVCVRGRTAGVFGDSGTFGWTSAVRAICAIALRAKLNSMDPHSICYIEGGRGSLAASIDYALAKQPSWLCEMFGVSAGGEAFAKAAFLVSNPSRRRPGPVSVSVNKRQIPSSEIEIFLDGQSVTRQDLLLALIDRIEMAVSNRASTAPYQTVPRASDNFATLRS